MNGWLCSQLNFFKGLSFVAEILFVLGISVYGLILVMYALLDVKTLDLLTKPLYSNEVLPYVKGKIRAKYLPNLFLQFMSILSPTS